MKKPESLYCHELKDSFYHLFGKEGFWLKIPDMPLGQEQRENLPLSIKFNPKKPFDIITVIKGQAIAIEAKVADKNGTIKFDRVSVHQAGNLQLFTKAGGKAYVAVQVSDNLSLFIPIDRWIQMKYDLKQFNIDYLSPNSNSEYAIVRRETYGKTIWDIEELITGKTLQSKLEL